MTDEIQRFQHLYEIVIEFGVAYSFQVLGALIILVAGMIRGRGRSQETRWQGRRVRNLQDHLRRSRR